MWTRTPNNISVFCVSLVMVLALGSICLYAQEKVEVSGNITATYTRQDSVVVGDEPGHLMILGVSDGVNASTAEHVFMDGTQIVNISYSDLVMGNGINEGYIIFLDKGDTTFAKWAGKVTTTIDSEGSPATTFEGTFSYTKGTGKYENIAGSGTYKGKFTSNEEYTVTWQGAYAIDK